ncbi:DNA gyrase/topoisomerase IV subunit A [Rufibacter glacialis]|uniref:DNA gyrase/topoisomerase IV subunit A n=1 Tax=Rufibacter glacialis TaxID=1259555 RepID=A0A5M8Q7Y8_9BACT|nr:DNA gyrase/topoisomerase IV subunit A [Rufibacter glacialis]KAA6431949.1 DNA gyrase/topoisomerase IV subunit A [Rufibacter glacialis]GGK80162.1 DNA topoisomerase IV subunit A [Rufibacter glacialis]
MLNEELENENNLELGAELEGEETIHDITSVSGLYENWFLDYASYVILERAVPALEDGFKPVQRRIMHAMKEMDDGRFNKVANVIGQTMQYHPHGDASIGDAIVNLGQKDLLIETQGNWGDVRTGDSAAAPRYIEARLTKFALDVVFNGQTTEWQLSYDGRKNEPVTLPVKFPLLLAQGVEGIAVGLSTKIMPHNFRELIKGSIDVLKGRPTHLLPDFPTGGLADFTNYNGGGRGGKIRLRATIEKVDKSLLVIKDVPYGTTTTALMDSIVKASENNKIKIKKVVDNTAADVEIQVHIPPGISPDLTIDALYAFTDCEVSISPNTCVIIEDKPRFLNVDELLRMSTVKTVRLLERELEIRMGELEDKWHQSSLEKIFIENRIYRDIEECETWEAVLVAIDQGLDPFKPILRREVTQEDIIRLTEIKIKRISKFDSFKADEFIKKLEEEMAEVLDNLANLTRYAISYFEGLLAKYGKGKERKTQIRTFDVVSAQKVAVANQKLYVNRKDGFVGYGLKKDEFVCDCSDMDDIIAIRKDGKFMVSRISDKIFMGKDIIYVGVYNKNDEHMVYNMIYVDGKTGISFAKRFAVTSITRDKEYDLTKGEKNSKVVYLTANPNSESELVSITLQPASTARVKQFDFDFAELLIKGKGSQGNIVTKHPIKKVVQKELGVSTRGGRDIYYDEVIGRLNTENRGRYLGSFNTDDSILVIYKDGSYEMTSFDVTNHYDVQNIEVIHKFSPELVVSAVYTEGETKVTYVKRFVVETSTIGKRFIFISESKGSKLLAASVHPEPKAEIKFQRDKKSDKESETLLLSAFIDVKGWRAIGNKLNYFKIFGITIQKEEEAAPTKVKNSTKQVKSVKVEPKQVPAVAASYSTGEEVLLEIEAVQQDIGLSVENEQSDDLPTPVKAPKKQLNLF